MSWLLAFIGFSALIVLHELGHFLAAKRVGMRAERFFLFFPPKVVGIKRGETEYGIGAIPLGGFVKITGMNPEEELPPDVEPRAFYRQPVWKRIVVIAAGPAMNLLVAFVLLFAVAVGFGLLERTGQVGELTEDSPAAGKLRAGDEIVAVDGESVRALEPGEQQVRIAELVNTHRCPGEPEDGCRARTPVELTVIRDGGERTVSVTPRFDADVGTLEGEEGGRMLVGFGYQEREVKESLPGGVSFAADRMWTITTEGVLGIFPRLFEGEGREEISSVVGIYEVTRQSVEFGAREALLVLAAISLVLAVLNLLPFLPLDGGHIAWAVAEKVKGRRIPLATMARWSSVGIVLLVLLVTIGLTNDINRLSGEGFDLR